jgi:type I restriction enzyme S subunit
MIYEGNHKLGDFFTSRRERGTPGLPMLSVTMNNGVVTRESLDRKMETNLSDEEHLLVRKDDIVYNMMRMWQGASGLADRDGLLSPAYVVLAPKQDIDPLYASYLFKSSRLIYLLWAYSYGLTSDRLRLYFNDFKRIPVNIPSLPEQRKIGKILSTWDKAINKTEKLIEVSLSQKLALKRKLLTRKLRFSEFQDEWVNTRFQWIIEGKRRKGSLASTNEKMLGVPYIGASSLDGEFNLFTEDKDVVLCKEENILMLWDGENAGKVATGLKGAVSSTVVCYSFNINKVDVRFIAFFLEYDNSRIRKVREGSGIPHMPGDFEQWYKFELPPLAEQRKIARILTIANREIETLQQKLASLKQEKKALMQQLLTGKRRVKADES